MRRPLLTLLLAILGTVASWAWAQAPSPRDPVADPGGGRVALVLGGGAARGTAHVGVIRALTEAGVPIDMILGTSMGSLIGGLYAAGFDVDTLADAVVEVDPTSAAELLLPPRGGILDLQPLSILLDALLEGRRLQEVTVPFYPVVIDLLTGEPEAAPAASLADAIRASTAIPVLFDPVPLGDRYYYDGGLKQTIPTSLARSLGASYVIAVDVTREIPYQPDQVQANLSRIFISIVESFNAAELADTDVILDPGLRDNTYMDFGLTADFVAAGERVARAELPRIIADLDALGIALRPPGDPNAGHPINDGWRERLAVARRDVEVRPRPWNLAVDLALAQSASGERVTPAPASVASRLRFGVELRDGPLGRGYLGASYARSVDGGSDAVQLRAGYRLAYAWSVFALADVAFDGPWAARWGVRWLALPSLTLETALRQPLLALDAAARWRDVGLWLDGEGTLALDGSWTRGHLEARATVGVADPGWAAWTLRTRALVGRASADAPTTERFSVGPATGLRGTPPNAWIAAALATGSLEVALRLGDDRAVLEAALIAPSVWAFVDGAWFDTGAYPTTAWAVGVGAGLDGSLFGFVPFALGVDLGYGIATGTWRLGWRVGPQYPEPLRF